jgi:tetratricopeptide (TPR) repeat protein
MAQPERKSLEQAAEIDRLATALAKDPKSKAFMPLAEAYIKADMWAEASVVLEDGLKVYPGFVTAMAALGRVYEQLNQPVKAKTILEEVIKSSPDNLRAHRVLAKLYAAEGSADLALRSCAAILGVSPYDEEAWSIKRRITGAPEDAEPPRSKRDRKRARIEPASKAALESPRPYREPATMAAQVAVSNEAQEPPDSTVKASIHPAFQPTETEPADKKHSHTIARLEGWLRLIQAKRRGQTALFENSR